MSEIRGMVGAFWVLPGPCIIGEACGLAEADHVGDNYNGQSGHDSLWPGLVKPASLAGRVYATVARGRVLYRARDRCFAVVAAPEIVSDPEAQLAVELFYGLSDGGERVSWETDPHYETQPDLVDEGDDFPAE